MRLVGCDGSPASAGALADALEAALEGGAAVVPYAGAAPALPDADPLGAALLIETSGSTGAAKRVCLPASALRASAEATHARLGGPGCWLLALPAHHVAGAQVIVRGLLAGHRPVVLDSRDGFRAERFAAAVDRLPDGRRYTSLVPTQLHRVLTAGGAALDALRTFHGVLIGGAATPPVLLAAARSAGVNAVTTYGMSETSGGCVYDGRPLDGVVVSLDETGRISLAGPVLASGYLGLPEMTADAFAEDRFRTSDLGQWTPDGRLRVLGRADDVITTGGEKVHPAAVERVLAAQPGVRAACVVGVADPEWGQLVAAALVAEGSPDLAALADAVRTELGAPAVPRLLRTLDELPLRGVGKPDRAAVTRLLDETAT
ncbi:O-succinylbenzoic acid--CoA ligase [Pseudonocardia eucalypti]|uniref:o-succinylbenzoate--CoA ligase n=1 Tax=Pseudonocardia eucalypti TaxID=648755 RepID=UPI001610BF18|nr:O-succinylbenzoic acid--CoA ligase [Pseudonocardia eucalypti]